MKTWRTPLTNIDYPIIPEDISLTRDGYNHFICVCTPEEVDEVISKYSDDVKVIVITDRYQWDLEYKAIVCYNEDMVYNYVNTPTSDVKKRYTFLGCRGLRKYWLHMKLSSWSFVREQNSVDYYRFEYTGDKNIDKLSYTVSTSLKTPIDTRSIRNVSKDQLSSAGSFVPRTINLDRFVPRNGNVYIVKPVASSGGEGITVVSDSSELAHARTVIGCRKAVVCDYIRNPKLFNGKKFHLRCYFMVTTWRKHHLYPKFKIITAKLPYIDDDYLNRDIHDTHIKTTQSNYFYPDDMSESNYFSKVNLICNTLGKIIRPRGYTEAKHSYEILGLDILIDNNNKAWLLEVNATPGMHPVNDDYSDYDSFEKGILEWEFTHAINI